MVSGFWNALSWPHSCLTVTVFPWATATAWCRQDDSAVVIASALPIADLLHSELVALAETSTAVAVSVNISLYPSPAEVKPFCAGRDPWCSPHLGAFCHLVVATDHPFAIVTYHPFVGQVEAVLLESHDAEVTASSLWTLLAIVSDVSASAA